MTTYNFYKVSLCYREDMPLRSCRNCQRRTSCTSIVGKDWRFVWLDLAKCGCHLY